MTELASLIQAATAQISAWHAEHGVPEPSNGGVEPLPADAPPSGSPPAYPPDIERARARLQEASMEMQALAMGPASNFLHPYVSTSRGSLDGSSSVVYRLTHV